MREKILAYCIQYQGSWQRIAQAIRDEEAIRRVEYQGLYVTVMDEQYPQKLRALRFPPWILFYRGNLSLCEKPSLGVVGSRRMGEYGKACTRQICKTVLGKRVIVSGMARGVDTEAHLSSLNGETIGVLGCGLDVVYPRENNLLQKKMGEQQLLLSEYPPTTVPRPHHFPWRNRIIAGLSDRLAIPQAAMRSGTMVTASLAMEMGKELYCIPYHWNEEEGAGCNELISDGAEILLHFEDLC